MTFREFFNRCYFKKVYTLNSNQRDEDSLVNGGTQLIEQATKDVVDKMYNKLKPVQKGSGSSPDFEVILFVCTPAELGELLNDWLLEGNFDIEPKMKIIDWLVNKK